MPPKVRLNEVPATIKPYQAHGVNIDYVDGAEDVYGDCPFCGREGKFAVNVPTGMWRCLVCVTGTDKGGGNVYTFLRQLHVVSFEATTPDDYAALCEARGLLDGTTPMQWGCAKSVLDGTWMIPGFDPTGKLNQLYRYVRSGDKYALWATPGCSHQIFGMQEYDDRKPMVYVCEGPWDGMALYETLQSTRVGVDAEYVYTSSAENCLLRQCNVIATPGCSVFPEAWVKTGLFAGKNVVLMYDNDHPKEHPPGSGRYTRAGYDGMRRATIALASSEEVPSSVHYLHWGKDGTDLTLPSGTDVRDMLNGSDERPDRSALLGSLLQRVQPVPAEWVPGGGHGKGKSGNVEMECVPCNSWRELITAWRKAMKWTDGLEHGLSTMLASIISTMCVGDQLWVKVIGPASCGKSTLCEAVSVARKYVKAKSTIRGFHSGYKTDKDGEEDHSLLSQLNGMTLVTKDGDTLLQSVNLGQILSEARDIYDRVSRTSYRHGMNRDYEGLSMTWILCGTSSLRAIDSSELGERFLDCVIMEGIDTELEDEILWRVVQRSFRNVATEVNGTPEDRQDAEMTRAMQLTGGYVNYLRENASDLIGAVDASDNVLRQCVRLGKFVAYLRARPSQKQDESSEREFGARLVSQMVRLARCLAAVLGKRHVDEEVMYRVSRIARDTARGKTMEICRHLAAYHEVGVEVPAIMTLTNTKPEKVHDLIRFMCAIGIIESFRNPDVRIKTGRTKYRMKPNLKTLWDSVMG